MAQVRNAVRSDRKQKYFTWKDFFSPFRKPERKRKTLDEMRAQFYETLREKNELTGK